MTWLGAHTSDLGMIAARAALIYAAALVALRLAQRRTLAQWTAIDFAAAVATGAIIGQTAVNQKIPFLDGAVALLTLAAVHWLVSFGRYNELIAKVVDHRVRVLVHNGELRHDQLRRCGLTTNDVLSQLRQQGHLSLHRLRYVLYETKGGLTVVPYDAPGDQQLVEAGLRDATGLPRK